jgi:hypothetical protein
MTRAKSRLRKELLVAAVLLSFGLAALPVLVYWVGSRVVGEYYPDSGLSDFVWHIWSDLAAGSVLAWILIVSPYLIIQLLRLALILWRRRPDVSSVTVSDVNQ